MFSRLALKFPWLLSLILHGLILLALIQTIDWKNRIITSTPSRQQTIKARVIDESKIRAEKERKRQQQLRKEREQARKQAEKRRKALEKKRLAEKKQQEEQRRKAALKRKKLAEEKAKKEKFRRQKAEQARLKKARETAERQRKAQLEAAEKERLRKERERQEAEARAKIEAEKEAQRREAEAELRRQMMSEEQGLNTAIEEQTQSIINEYEVLLKKKIERYWVRPKNSPAGLSCELQVRLIPGGDVVEVKVTRSSGNSIFDRSAINAVKQASPLPIPDDITLFNRFKLITYDFSPDE